MWEMDQMTPKKANERSSLDARATLWLHFEGHSPGAGESER